MKIAEQAVLLMSMLRVELVTVNCCKSYREHLLTNLNLFTLCIVLQIHRTADSHTNQTTNSTGIWFTMDCMGQQMFVYIYKHCTDMEEQRILTILKQDSTISYELYKLIGCTSDIMICIYHIRKTIADFSCWMLYIINIMIVECYIIASFKHSLYMAWMWQKLQ
jgi:hypothetical protein